MINVNTQPSCVSTQHKLCVSLLVPALKTTPTALHTVVTRMGKKCVKNIVSSYTGNHVTEYISKELIALVRENEASLYTIAS